MYTFTLRSEHILYSVQGVEDPNSRIRLCAKDTGTSKNTAVGRQPSVHENEYHVTLGNQDSCSLPKMKKKKIIRYLLQAKFEF